MTAQTGFPPNEAYRGFRITPSHRGRGDGVMIIRISDSAKFGQQPGRAAAEKWIDRKFPVEDQ